MAGDGLLTGVTGIPHPAVDHPRWSQATERRIGGGLFSSRQPTLMFNGYGEVASLYEGMDLRESF